MPPPGDDASRREWNPGDRNVKAYLRNRWVRIALALFALGSVPLAVGIVQVRSER